MDESQLCVAYAEDNARNELPRGRRKVFEGSIGGKIHRVEGQALQRWILRERHERRGPAGYVFGKRPLLDESRREGQ